MKIVVNLEIDDKYKSKIQIILGTLKRLINRLRRFKPIVDIQEVKPKPIKKTGKK